MGNQFPKTHASTHAAGGIDPVQGAGPPPGPENSHYVLSLADLPQPVGGVVTLEPGVDYVVIGPVDMGANSLIVGGCSIRGYAPQTAALFWTAAPAIAAVRLRNEGWIENLTLTCPFTTVIRAQGDRKKRVQLCDLVGSSAPSEPVLQVSAGSDGLQCYDTFFRGHSGVRIRGGAQIANASFDLTGQAPTARAFWVADVLAWPVLLESAQVRFGVAGQVALLFDPGTGFAPGYQGLLSGLQCEGPGAPLPSPAVPLGWKLTGNPQLFAGLYTVRQVTGPASVTLGPEDEVVDCDSTAGPITVNLPQTFTGHRLSIRDVAGAAGANAIACTGVGGASVEGVPSVSITTPYGFFEMFAAVAFPNDIDWWISSGG